MPFAQTSSSSTSTTVPPFSSPPNPAATNKKPEAAAAVVTKQQRGESSSLPLSHQHTASTATSSSVATTISSSTSSSIGGGYNHKKNGSRMDGTTTTATATTTKVAETNGVNKTKKSRRHNKNRRSNSDIPATVTHGGGGMMPMGFPPPPTAGGGYSLPPPPPSPVSSYNGGNTPPYNPYYGQPTPPYHPPLTVQTATPPPQYSPRYSRNKQVPPLPISRDRTWSQDSGHSAPGSGGGARHSSHRSSHQHRPRSQRHRRTLSGSAALPGSYGSFWASERPAMSRSAYFDDDEEDITGVSQSFREPGASRREFSPRAEIRKLAQGMSPTRDPRKSVSASAASPGVTWSPQMDTSMQLPPPPPPPPIMGLPGPALAQQTTIGLPHTSSFGSTGNRSFEGEAAFNQQRGGTRRTSHRRTESSRKMHMRQQSAQLYMEDVRGVEQPLACRNVFFLLLFVFHLVFLGYLAQMFGENAFRYHGDDEEEVTVFYDNLVKIACWSGVFAMTVSALLLLTMTLFARHFVQIALILVIALSFIWGTIGIGFSPKTVVPVTGIIALALAVAYALIVWDRIPFAAANLLTALSAIRDFPGTVVMAVGFQILALLWCVFYSILVVAIYDAIQEESKTGLSPRVAKVIYVLLGFSFYWTIQVLQGTVQAITAGIVKGWWHTPEDGTVVRQSCFKTLFYSTGSICLGSLFVGPVRILRQLSALFRPSSSDGASSLMFLHECVHCIQLCLTSCVDSIGAVYNSWAFTYVGMYNYGFLDSGRHATDVFEKRGWTTIVSDDLVPNVLFLTSLVVGGITGCFAHFISQLDNLAVTANFAHGDKPGVVPFVAGVIIGLVLPSIVFSIISSAVNAVLVCFATSPVQFEVNHPDLSHEMRSSWREVWPGALDINDVLFAASASNSFGMEDHPLLL